MTIRLGLLLLPGIALGLAACASRPPATHDLALTQQSASDAAAAAPTVEAVAPLQPLTLEEAIEWALQNNPSLKARYTKFEAMLQEEPQASSLMDPMAMVSQQQAFRGMGDEQSNMLTLSQTFPWFGKRALRGGIARSEAMQALEEYRAQALDIRRDIIRAWQMLRYERANLELTRQEHDLLQQILQVTTAQYEVGQADRAALLQVQAEMARTEAELHAMNGAIEVQRRELAVLLGTGRGWVLKFDTDAADEIADLPNTQRLIDEAIANRPELEGLQHQQDAARGMAQLARADYYPDFTVGVGMEAMGSDGSGFYRPDSDTRMDSWIVSLGVNIPIPNARRRAATEQARLREQETELLRDSAENEILAQIQSTFAMAEALRRQKEVYESGVVGLALEAYKTAESGYRVGRFSYADLIDVQRTLIAARRDVLRIERDRQLAIADLERAVGLPLELVTDAQESRP